MYSCGYLAQVCNVITIHEHIIFRKVFIWIFSRLIDIQHKYSVSIVMYFCEYLVDDVTIMHTNIIFRNVFFSILSRWIDI